MTVVIVTGGFGVIVTAAEIMVWFRRTMITSTCSHEADVIRMTDLESGQLCLCTYNNWISVTKGR